MKTLKHFTSALLILISISVTAQQGINYKAIVKDGTGNVVTNDLIAVQFIIYKGAALTDNVYQETHTPTTDANGLVILNIGEGISGDVFTNIDWGSDDHYLNVQIDTGGGLVDMGTTQFMAVPYALYAESVKTCDLAIGDTYAGGIIFYLDSSGCHGLVCAPTDQAIDVPAATGIVHTINNGIGAGFINTEIIVSHLEDQNYVARLCYDLELNGYDDWYLPSKYELDLMQQNIGGAAPPPNTNIGNFTPWYDEISGEFWSRFYWSSNSYSINPDSFPLHVYVTQLASDYISADYYEISNASINAVRAIRVF